MIPNDLLILVLTASSQVADWTFCLLADFWHRPQCCCSHIYPAQTIADSASTILIWNLGQFITNRGRVVKLDQESATPRPWSFLVAQMVENLPVMQEMQVPSLGREDSLEKGMTTHSSILAWRIPWTEEPGGPQSMGSQSQTQLRD